MSYHRYDWIVVMSAIILLACLAAFVIGVLVAILY